MKFWNTNKFLTIGLLLVLAVVAYVSNLANTSSKSLDIAPEYFATLDSAGINKIQLSVASGKTVTLQKNGSEWMVNNAYKASKMNINRILFILANVRVKREFSGPTEKETIAKLTSEGTKVQVFVNNKLDKEFIMDNGDITSSSCFYSSATQKAYFVELPAYTDVFSRFVSADLNMWRSRLICENQLKQIDRVITTWEGKKVQIKYQNDFFKVENVNHLDSMILGRYLIQYRNLECDKFLEDSSKSLCTRDFSKAFGSVQIQDIDSTKNTNLYFFNIPNEQKYFLGYSTMLKECFWISKNKAVDLLIESEKLFEKRKED